MGHSVAYIDLMHYQVSQINIAHLKQLITTEWQDLVGALGDYVYLYEKENEYIILTLPCYIYRLSQKHKRVKVKFSSLAMLNFFEKEFLIC